MQTFGIQFVNMEIFKSWASRHGSHPTGNQLLGRKRKQALVKLCQDFPRWSIDHNGSRGRWKYPLVN